MKIAAEIKKVNFDNQTKQCYHCGNPCTKSKVVSGDKVFCCVGCKHVYEILDDNDLCTYYDIDKNPGITQKEQGLQFRFQYLDDLSVVNRLLDFSDDKNAKVTFTITSIHCSSCIWLLENLYKMNPSIIDSKVNFLKKQLSIVYLHENISLREIVEILASVGYEPEIQLAELDKKKVSEENTSLYIKLGIAGFAFANIMLFSFPEYLSMGEGIGPEFRKLFGYLSLFLAIPVLIYSSNDYFQSALSSFKQKTINMDVPISLGILALFSRSFVDIVIYNQLGYLDSFTGLVFLLLIGKIFQKKTYDTLSFERDYKSFFPVSVIHLKDGKEYIIPLSHLKVRDRILIKNNEIIPADAVLINGSAVIDYSFVTGESVPLEKKSGDILYAGGKQIGGAIEADIIKEISQSYLTQLWNNDVFKKAESGNIMSLANRISKYFTVIILSIASSAALYWWFVDADKALNAFTSVLIIACPCALALSTPFTLGNSLRIFGRKNFYLKSIHTIETLAKIKNIVFDKTGTITQSEKANVRFKGTKNLKLSDKILIKSLVRHSSHPLSQKIYSNLDKIELETVTSFQEFGGKGIQGYIKGNDIRIGSAEFTGVPVTTETASQVHVKINDVYKGFFVISNKYRNGLKNIITELKNKYSMFLISGDNDTEKTNLSRIFADSKNLHFNQTPYQKLNFIRRLQILTGSVLMIGDGLNDAGALKQSDVGISVSENSNVFSPACDGILEAKNFEYLPKFIQFARTNMKIIIASFIISFLYNVIGVSFAVQGTLSPLISAILMPISSVSVIVFTTGMTSLFSRRIFR